MPARRASVYLSDRTLTIAGEGESLSGRLNQIVSRYDDIVRHVMPEFPDNEWCAIFDANNGAIVLFAGDEPTDLAFSGVWANVADSQGFDDKWRVDVDALAQKLRALPASQKIAVLEAIQTFWEHHEKPTDEALVIAVKRDRRAKPVPVDDSVD